MLKVEKKYFITYNFHLNIQNISQTLQAKPPDPPFTKLENCLKLMQTIFR